MSDLPALAPALEAEISELENLMVTDRREYNRRAGRYHELIEARQSGGGAAPRQSGEREMAEIQRVMRTDPKRYYRDEAMQARYRDLLDAQEPAAPAAGDPEPQPGDVVPLMPPSEWMNVAEKGADYGVYRDAVTAANDVLNAAGDAAGALDTSFSALPGTIRAVAVGELVNRSAVPVDPVPEDDLNAILREGNNAALAREWGGSAPHKFAVVSERLWRVIDRLSDADAVAFIRWHAGLPPAASAALARRIAG